MTRPCFLVVDREHSQSISTRKLVIETAKFNVLTAYSASEALDTIKRFPAVGGIVVDAEMMEMTGPEFIAELRKFAPKMTVIGVGGPLVKECEGADYKLESFDPRRLLALLEKLHPQDAAAVEERNRELEKKEREIDD